MQKQYEFSKMKGHKNPHVQRGGMKDGDKDWQKPCMNCGAKPTMHPTGLCGPCCTGEAETADGNW